MLPVGRSESAYTGSIRWPRTAAPARVLTGAWLDVPYSEKDKAKAEQASRRVDDAGRTWIARSECAWHLDLRMLTNAGVRLQRPNAPDQRAHAVERALADHRAGPERNTERGAHRS